MKEKDWYERLLSDEREAMSSGYENDMTAKVAVSRALYFAWYHRRINDEEYRIASQWLNK